MAENNDPQNKPGMKQQLQQVRVLGIRLVIVAIMVSGWLAVINVYYKSTQADKQLQEQAEREKERAEHGGRRRPSSRPVREEEKPGDSYVMPYALALVSIAAGLMVVTRTSNRRNRAQPEQFAAGSESNSGKKE